MRTGQCLVEPRRWPATNPATTDFVATRVADATDAGGADTELRRCLEVETEPESPRVVRPGVYLEENAALWGV